MLRYSGLLFSQLIEQGANVSIWHPPEVLGRLWSFGSGIGKWFAYIDKFIIGAIWLAIIQFRFGRIHICDHSNAMYAHFMIGRVTTVTCHDVIAIQAARGQFSYWKVSWSGRLLQRWIENGLFRAQSVYCVSKYTARELLVLDICVPSRIKVALNVVASEFKGLPSEDASAKPPSLDEIGQFIIHVGSDLPRKNRTFVFELFSRLTHSTRFADCSLVIVGPPPTPEQFAILEKSGLTERLIHFQGLSDHELAHLYRNALALVFPSTSEGFGWPIVEAQACGCPVFAMAIEPMMEVGGQAARYFASADVGDAVNTFLTTDLQPMRAAGVDNATRFKLNQMAASLEL